MTDYSEFEMCSKPCTAVANTYDCPYRHGGGHCTLKRKPVAALKEKPND